MLENLILKKEEIPILNETCFQVPIHPIFLSDHVSISENLAKEVFPKAVKEWYEDLIRYSDNLCDKNTKEYINEFFLKSSPNIEKKHGNQIITPLCWEDNILTLENGFVCSFSIRRNSGGTLWFNKEDMNCRVFVSLNNSYSLFPKEKIIEYVAKDQIINPGDSDETASMYVYAQHNIDNYPGALLLRNWAIIYLNEAMRQTLKY